MDILELLRCMYFYYYDRTRSWWKSHLLTFWGFGITFPRSLVLIRDHLPPNRHWTAIGIWSSFRELRRRSLFQYSIDHQAYEFRFKRFDAARFFHFLLSGGAHHLRANATALLIRMCRSCDFTRDMSELWSSVDSSEVGNLNGLLALASYFVTIYSWTSIHYLTWGWEDSSTFS